MSWNPAVSVSSCGGVKRLDDFGNAGRVQGVRQRVRLAEGSRAGGDDLPASFVRTQNRPAAQGRSWLACALHGRVGFRQQPALRPHKASDSRAAPGMGITPDAHVAREMRPSRVTAVASTMISAAPPTARLPRWTKCQVIGHAFLRTVLAHQRHRRCDCETLRLEWSADLEGRSRELRDRAASSKDSPWPSQTGESCIGESLA